MSAGVLFPVITRYVAPMANATFPAYSRLLGSVDATFYCWCEVGMGTVSCCAHSSFTHSFISVKEAVDIKQWPKQ